MNAVIKPARTEYVSARRERTQNGTSEAGFTTRGSPLRAPCGMFRRDTMREHQPVLIGDFDTSSVVPVPSLYERIRTRQAKGIENRRKVRVKNACSYVTCSLFPVTCGLEASNKLIGAGGCRPERVGACDWGRRRWRSSLKTRRRVTVESEQQVITNLKYLAQHLE